MVDRTTSEVLDAVRAADAGVDSIVALVTTLRDQVTDALGKAITPQQQADLNEIFDRASSDATKINAAIGQPAQPVNQ